MLKFLKWFDENLLTLISGFLLLFIPLYPKLPLMDVLPGYIVRVRLEDFFVSGAILVWIYYLFRGRIKLSNYPLIKPISAYLIAGMLSIASAVLITGTIPNETLHIGKAVLHLVRRIEYFSLFFIFFTSIKSIRTVKILLSVLAFAVISVALYGFGQKYLYWPAFSTMNREFSKGWMLYLTEHARVLSTFGGHYDLAAYIMMMLVLFWSLFFGVKKIILKIFIFILISAAFWTLILTASRSSFIAYIVGLTFMFFFWAFRKSLKWVFSRWFVTVFMSIAVMLTFGDLSERFTKLLRIDERVSGIKTLLMLPIGKPPKDKAIFLENNPDAMLAEITSKSDQPPTPKRPSDVYEDIPLLVPIATGSATVAAIPRTYSQTAFRYDLSTAIRFDALWPMAIKGFRKNPILGSGYSTLNKLETQEFTEAESTDNDYLRALGETGLLGFITFYGTLLLIIYIIFRHLILLKDNILFSAAAGVTGLMFGLLTNAVYIDVFESSKVAFTFWSLVGIILSGIYILKKEHKGPVQFPRLTDWTDTRNLLSKRLGSFLRSRYFPLVLILILGFYLRLYKINTPLADWHSWRQADTSSVTRNYVRNGINILYPVYDDLSNVASGKDNPKGYRFVEFPLYNAASVIVDKIFVGFNIEFSGRLTSVLSAMGTVIFIYFLALRYFSRREAVMAAFIYAVLPYNVYYTRVILPEPFLVFLSTGMIFWFDKFTGLTGENSQDIGKSGFKKSLYFTLSLLFAVSAVLVKPYALFLFPVLIYIFLMKRKLSIKNIIYILVFLGLSVLPFVLWRLWISNFPEGVPAYDWLLNGDNIRFKGAFFYWIFADRLGRLMLGYWGLPFLAMGILYSRRKNIGFLYVWGICILTYLCVIATGNVRHDYYQIMTVPVIALFLAIGISSIWDQTKYFGSKALSLATIAILFIFSLMFSWYHIRDFYNINHPEIVDAGGYTERNTPSDALVIAPYNGDTAFLYQTRRAGWPVMQKPVEEMVKMGAKYYVSVNFDKQTAELIKDANNPDPEKRKYKIVNMTDKYVLIQLVPDREL